MSALADSAGNEQFSKLRHAAFPAQPKPERFFWKEGVHDVGDEPCSDLLRWLAQRQWTEITITDWAMIGHIGVARQHLEPATFLYYLPSLLLGSLNEPGYLEWALEAILPSGKDRKPKGSWWAGLLEAISLDQCTALRAFLAHIRGAVLRSDKGPFWITAAEALTSEAEAFWDEQLRCLRSRER